MLWAVRNGPGTLFRLDRERRHLDARPDERLERRQGASLPGRHRQPGQRGRHVRRRGLAVRLRRDRAQQRREHHQPPEHPALRRRRPPARTSSRRTSGSSSPTCRSWAQTSASRRSRSVPDIYLVANAFFDEIGGPRVRPGEYPIHGTRALPRRARSERHHLRVRSEPRTARSAARDHHERAPRRDGPRVRPRGRTTCGRRATTPANGKSACFASTRAPSSATFGRFVIRRKFDRPTTMPNLNNEGIAFAPEAECVGGQKAFFWADDSETGGHDPPRHDSVRQLLLKLDPRRDAARLGSAQGDAAAGAAFDEWRLRGGARSTPLLSASSSSRRAARRPRGSRRCDRP